jgi:hypothetical protein
VRRPSAFAAAAFAESALESECQEHKAGPCGSMAGPAINPVQVFAT